MNQWRVIYTFLFVFIVAASCRRAFDFRQSGIAINTLAEHLYTNIPAADDSNNDKKPENTYIVSNGNKTCTWAQMNIFIPVPYKTKGDESKDETRLLNVPADATVNGTCTRVLSEMTLSWKPPEKTKSENSSKEVDKNNTIRFIFLNDHTSFSVFSVDVNIYLDDKNFPNKTDTVDRYIASSENDLRLFAAPLIKGKHTCNEETKIRVNGTEEEISIKDVTLIAFNEDDNVTSHDIEAKCDPQEKKGKTFNYSLKDKEGKVCLLAKMSISLNIHYETKNDNANVTIPVPDADGGAEVSGTCDSNLSTMILIWNPKGKSTDKNQIIFEFRRTEKKTYLREVKYSIILDEEQFLGSIRGKKVGFGTIDEFSASAQNGMYNCANETRIKVMDDEVIISEVLLVAFDVEKDFTSKNVSNCKYSFENTFKYVVKNENTEIPCMMANMAINISIPYETEDKKITIGNSTVEGTAVVSGSCGLHTSRMTISWTSDKKLENNITFWAYRNETFFYVFDVDANIYLDKKYFPQAVKQNELVSERTAPGAYQLFSADAENGHYVCTNQDTMIKLGRKITLNVTNVSFIAFNTASDVKSKKETECSKKPNDDDVTTAISTSDTTAPTDVPPTDVPSTEAPPELDPSVKDYKYVVINTNDPKKACIAAKMKMSMTVSYQQDDKIAERTISVPEDVETTGDCGDASSTMKLTWPKKATYAQDEANSITFTFKKTGTEYFLDSISITLILNKDESSDAVKPSVVVSKSELHQFSTPLGHLYKCDYEITIEISNVKLTMSDIALIAFNTEESLDKIAEKKCPHKVPEEPEEPEEPSYAGAIAGGVIGGIAALALIIFVIVMCRRRSAAINRNYG